MRLSLAGLILVAFSAPVLGEDAKAKSPPKVDYRVIDEWKIPNGGFGRVVVVARAHRNERDMKTLGDKLRSDTGKDRHAFVFIYDDEKAAKMRKEALAERLSKKDLKYHDKHSIGTYMRNANTGFHALSIFLDGVAGKTVDVEY